MIVNHEEAIISKTQVDLTKALEFNRIHRFLSTIKLINNLDLSTLDIIEKLKDITLNNLKNSKLELKHIEMALASRALCN
ncbi:MAG: hypothetical protein QXL46_03220 [Nitrososphaerales archaeon]